MPELNWFISTEVADGKIGRHNETMRHMMLEDRQRDPQGD